MDGCSLNDAFPDGAYASAGCLDTKVADESRRQEKKKARKCRGPASTYLNGGMNMVGPVDPDRPAVQRMHDVPQMNLKTGLTGHAPVTQQYEYEGFVGDAESIPTIRANVDGPSELAGNSPLQNFFGASPNDEPSTGQKKNFLEGFTSDSAPFVNVIGQDETYRLSPDFASTFDLKASLKATGNAVKSGPSSVSEENSYLTPTSMVPGSSLPTPNVDQFWKQHGLSGGQSSFFAQLRAPGGQPSGSAVDQNAEQDVPASRKEVLQKLDRIFARLDDMEQAKSENAQTEVLLFILTGLGVIFLMDVGCRAAMTVARR